jgi:hypothetical protein
MGERCSCGLWICPECRPEYHGDEELRKRLERASALDAALETHIKSTSVEGHRMDDPGRIKTLEEVGRELEQEAIAEIERLRARVQELEEASRKPTSDE